MFLDTLRLFTLKKNNISLLEKDGNINIFIGDTYKFEDFYSVSDFDLSKLHYYTTIRKVRIGAELFENDIDAKFSLIGTAFNFTTVKPNTDLKSKNLIFDIMDVTNLLTSKSKLVRLSSINDIIESIQEYAKTFKYHTVNIFYALSSSIEYDDSFIKMLLQSNKNNKELSFSYNLYFTIKDIAKDLQLVKVCDKDIPYNENKVITSYKRYSLMSSSIKELDKKDKIVSDTGNTVNKDVKDNIKETSNGSRLQSSTIEKAIKDGLILPEDLANANEQNSILIKSLSNALSDENTVKETQRYDVELLNKVVKDIDKKGLVEFVTEMKDATFDETKYVTKDNVNDILENKVLTNKTADFRRQYNQKLLKKDIVSSLSALEKHPVYPMFLQDVKFIESKETLNFKTTIEATFKDAKGKTINVPLEIPLLMDNNKSYLLEGTQYMLYDQLVAKPILKVKPDTVALTTNYNKWFMYRFGEEGTHSKHNKVIRELNNLKNATDFSVGKRLDGDENLSLSTYEIDSISKTISYISTSKEVFYFVNNKYTKELQTVFDSKYPNKQKEFIVVGVNSNSNLKRFFVINSKTTVFLFDGVTNELTNTGKSYLDFIIDKIPSKILKKPSRNTFTRVNVVGQKIPLIFLLLCGYSLKTILSAYNIKYSVFDSTETVRETNDTIKIKLADGTLLLFIDTVEKQLLMNGLAKLNDLEKFTMTDLFKKVDNPVLKESLSANTIRGCINSLRNMIDPITESILRQELLPTEILEVCLYANTLLRDDKFKKPQDFSSYRLRGEETFPAMIYRFMRIEQDKFAESYRRNPRLNFSVNKSQIMRDVITTLPNFSTYASANQYMEMNESEKVVFSGFLGLNSSESLTIDMRSPDATQEGIIDVNAIVDSSKAGAIKYGTMNMAIKNLRGNFSFETKDDFSTKLSYSGASEPFIASRADASRVAMSAIQQRHFLPLENFYDAPLVRTGTEEVAKQTLSNDFVIKSPIDGVITKIDTDNKVIYVAGKDNKISEISYKERNLHNGGAGFYHQNKFTLEDTVKVNSKISKNAVLALNNGVFKNSTLCNGKLLRVTYAPHPNLLEDASILSESVAKQAVMNYIDEKEVVVSPMYQNVLSIDKLIGNSVDIGDTLLRFTAKDDENSAVAGLNLSDDLFEDAYESVVSKIKGKIDNIKVYYNIGEEKLSKSVLLLLKELNKLDREQKLPITERRVVKVEGDKILGRRMKDTVIIKFFILAPKIGASGSKLTMQSTKSIYVVKKQEEMPRTLDDKPIDLQISSLSLISRMVPTNLLLMYTNKIIVYLREYILANKSNIKKVKSVIISILTKLLKNDKEMLSIEVKRFTELPDTAFSEKNIDKHLYFTIRPFKEPSLDDVKDGAKIISVPLEEYIYYPDVNNTVTKVKVPVGYISIRFLNQVIGKKVSQSHKVNEINTATGMLTNGSKVGQFSPDESLAMFSYGLEKEILPEFFNMRGDNLEARSSMEREIHNKGYVSLNEVSDSRTGQVQKTLDAYLLGAGLKSNLQQDYSVTVDGKAQDIRK